jgi:hypothetical protein
MPKKTGRRKNRSWTNNSSTVMVRTELKPEVVAYNGPSLPIRNSNVTLNTVTLSLNDTALTSGTGTYFAAIAVNPSNAIEWSDYVDAYDSYRILAMHVQFVPNTRYQLGNGGSTIMPAYVAVDRDDATTPTTVAAVAVKDNSKLVGMTDPWNDEWKMNARTYHGESEFLDCANPLTLGSIKVASTGNANNLTLGLYLIKYLVQFKGVD